MIKFLGVKRNIQGFRLDNYYYAVDVNGYEMGLEVVTDNRDGAIVTLFHWNGEYEKKALTHSAYNEESRGNVKLYKTKRGTYFNYNKKRVYLPDAVTYQPLT